MTNFSVIGIYVDDIDKAKNFYCDTLGFEVENTYDDGCIIQLKSDGPTVILETADKPANVVYPGGSQVVLCVATDNIKKTSEEFRAKGVDFLHDEPQPFVAGRFMAMKDPAGNTLELIEFKRE
ncbi:MAG: glyoxalase superfamily protein [Candidatus Thorarchaeota archaeon]|jgi:catechol 2,3-dioxygenase-like lactoylglutathione lyase family enzyme